MGAGSISTARDGVLGYDGYWKRAEVASVRSGWSEALCQVIRAFDEKSQIGSDGNEAIAPFDVAAGIGLARGKYASRLSDGLKPPHSILNGSLDLRMLWVSDMPQGCGEISGTDEHTVDTVDARDRLQFCEGGRRLDLHHDACLMVCLLEVDR